YGGGAAVPFGGSSRTIDGKCSVVVFDRALSLKIVACRIDVRQRTQVHEESLIRLVGGIAVDHYGDLFRRLTRAESEWSGRNCDVIAARCGRGSPAAGGGVIDRRGPTADGRQGDGENGVDCPAVALGNSHVVN